MKNIKHAIPVYLLVFSVLSLDTWAGNRVVSFGGSDSVPEIHENIMSISAGLNHSLALTDAGKVISWASGVSIQPYALPNDASFDVVAIAAGGLHDLALKSNGRVIAWGENLSGQTKVPSTAKSGIMAVSAGLMHSLALTKYGTVVAWGDFMFGQTFVPSGLDNVTSISAGALHSVALKSNGKLVAWGDNSFGQCNVPVDSVGRIVAVSAGYFHNLAITTNGEVVAWGDNTSGQCNVPLAARSGVVAVSAGQEQSLALKSTGELISWGGRSGIVQSAAPISIPNLKMISAGGFHSLGLVAAETDSNNNGIPDWWELQNGLDPVAISDASTDSDLDGFSNRDEYLAQTDPMDNTSYFRIQIANVSDAGNANVVFEPASQERLYTLQYAADISKNDWRPVSGNIGIQGVGNGNPGIMSVNSDKSSRIYRVIISVP